MLCDDGRQATPWHDDVIDAVVAVAAVAAVTARTEHTTGSGSGLTVQGRQAAGTQPTRASGSA